MGERDIAGRSSPSHANWTWPHSEANVGSLMFPGTPRGGCDCSNRLSRGYFRVSTVVEGGVPPRGPAQIPVPSRWCTRHALKRRTFTMDTSIVEWLHRMVGAMVTPQVAAPYNEAAGGVAPAQPSLPTELPTEERRNRVAPLSARLQDFLDNEVASLVDAMRERQPARSIAKVPVDQEKCVHLTRKASWTICPGPANLEHPAGLVSGERTHTGVNHPIRHWQTVQGDRRGLECQGGGVRHASPSRNPARISLPLIVQQVDVVSGGG